MIYCQKVIFAASPGCTFQNTNLVLGIASCKKLDREYEGYAELQ